MELDDNFKILVKELGQAINDSLADSERIAEVLARIRTAGYDLFLVLEVTVGVDRRGEDKLILRQTNAQDASGDIEFHFTNQDTQFLRALRISVDEGAPDTPRKAS